MRLHGTLRVIIVDHYDSYTNNILQLLQNSSETAENINYPEWSSAVVRFDQYTWEFFRDQIIPNIDAVILSPGPGRPDREADFGFNSKLIREANIPILGVCLGHQGIGTSFGAKIMHAPNIKHGQVSRISHTNTGILRDIPQLFDAVRYNSLVLDPDSLPHELEVTAWTYDPEDESRKVLMGVQHRSRPIFGVQWHPESVCSSYGRNILGNFRDIVLDYWNISSPWNSWTRRSVRINASLPQNLLEASAIVREAIEATPTTLPSQKTEPRRPYYIKAVDLGKGPKPQQVFEAFVRNSTLDGEVWLDSAKVRDVHSRNSYLAAATFAISYSTKDRKLSFYHEGKRLRSQTLQNTYWEWLNSFQSATIQRNTDAIPATQLGQTAEVGQPILQVGLIGYFGYEMKRESLPGYAYSPSTTEEANEDSLHTDAQLIFANKVLWLDNYTQTWKVVGLIRRGVEDPIAATVGLSENVGLTDEEFDRYVQSVREKFAEPSTPPYVDPVPLLQFNSIDNEETYSASIQAARSAIKEGESYELTLTTKFHATSTGEDPYGLYLSLRARNPAPYSAYLNFPTHDISILSSSPERFISIDREGTAEMKPIKGTVAVSSDQEENKRRIHNLETDIKERAENLMIVDLIRADLHNISPSKTIQVPKLLKVESYETVHQLVTTIQSQVASGVGPVKVLERIFPPGSMTGAPKLRSVQILDALENNADRGVYSGSLGYLCASGTIDQSVVIRTIVKKGRSLVLGAGGAITWLSEADREWNEVMVKANAVTNSRPLTIRPESRTKRFDSLEPLEDAAKEPEGSQTQISVDPVH